MLKVLGIIAGIVAGLVGIGWLGLQIKPAPFEMEETSALPEDTVALPDGLPESVARYLGAAAGSEQVPVVDTGVVTGRAVLRMNGLTLPARFRFSFIAGQSYRHEMEVTWFGRVIMKADEVYHKGKARMSLPFGVFENEPKIDQAANLALWGEQTFLISPLVSDPRVRWEPLAEQSARLVVPFGEDEDSFTVAFDAETGLISTMDAMRYKDADSELVPWNISMHSWGKFQGVTVPTYLTIQWGDERVPWSEWTVEDVAFNVDVSEAFAPQE